jgi:hypothetical protein
MRNVRKIASHGAYLLIRESGLLKLTINVASDDKATLTTALGQIADDSKSFQVT